MVDTDELRQIVGDEMRKVVQTTQERAAGRLQTVTTTWVDSMSDELVDNMNANSCYLMLLGAGGLVCVLWVLIVAVWCFVATPDSGLPLLGLSYAKEMPKPPVTVACSNLQYAYDEDGRRFKVDFDWKSMEAVKEGCKGALVEVAPKDLSFYYREVEGALPHCLLWGSPILACLLLAAAACQSPSELDFSARSKDTNMWVQYRAAMIRHFKHPKQDKNENADEAWAYLTKRNGKGLMGQSHLSDSLKKRVKNKDAVDAFLEICAKTDKGQFDALTVREHWIDEKLKKKWASHEKKIPSVIGLDAFVDVWTKLGVKSVEVGDDKSVKLSDK